MAVIDLPADAIHTTDPQARYNAWRKTPSGRKYEAARRTFTLERAAQDGTFRFEDVPAGNYKLQINPPEGRGKTVPVTVPEMPNGRSDEPLNLGHVPL